MKKIAFISTGVLLVLGLIFGRYIGRYFVNHADNKDTRLNNGDRYADQYIAGCDTIRLMMTDFKDVAAYFKVQGKFDASSADNTAYINQHQMVFYDAALHKYFDIIYFFSNNSNFDEVYGLYAAGLDKSETAIIGIVNKAELSDSSYGTQQKPVPVLYFYSAESCHSYFYTLIGQTNKPFKGDEEQFKRWMLNYNVVQYLSYVKGKADFEKMKRL